MHRGLIGTRYLILAFLLMAVMSIPRSLLAQGQFFLSKNADFSTEDRVFSRNDVMYMKVVAPQIDFTELDKDRFELKAIGSDDELEGQFTNKLNGTYIGSLDLSATNPNIENWKWEARIRDKSNKEFRAEVPITIQNGGNGAQVVEFTGTIESLGQNALVVNGLQVLIDNDTEIRGLDNELIAFSDLGVGDVVQVRALQQQNGDLLATRIKLESVANEIEVTGSIESKSAQSLVVLGKTFLVDSETEILDSNNNPISFDALDVGQTVQVRGRDLGNGTFLATRIKVEDVQGNVVELTGAIESIGGQNVVVDSLTFLVTSTTEILDSGGSPISLSDLSVGLVVEIRGEIGGDGILRATRIQIEDQLGQDEIEVTGTVTEVGETHLTAAGLTFQVDAATEILDENGNAIGFSVIQVGFVVEVRADVLSDGTLMATRIKIEDRFEAEIEITGVIQSKGENMLRVADFDFQVTAETEIVDNEDTPIGFEDLNVGAVVEIKAVRTADDQLIATRIKLKDVFQDEVELTGNIDSIDGQTVVVAGIAFVVDANTEILDNDENPVAFSVLTVGLLIEVRGVVQSNGDILATRIKIEDRIEDEVQVVGVIEQVNQSAITVLGRTFGITENTIVTDENENLIDLSGLFIGQTVKIRGDLLPDGTLIAIVIRLEDQQAQEIQVVGPVDTKTDNTLEVVGIHFFLTDTTEVLDETGGPIPFSALEIGKTVEVRAAGQPNGTRIATQIKIQDVLLLTGTIQQVVLNGISVVGKEVLFDSNTLILGKLNGFLTHDDLKVGQFVEIRAQQGNDNILFATKVKVQDRVTSVVPAGPLSGPTPPENFVLLQNYPNPFNPTTTITFDIPESAGGIVDTEVTVFNLLGQTVRTLVDAPMAPGRHRVRWDGRDDSGRAMPTGVYLYRLKAGKITKTNRMLLLK